MQQPRNNNVLYLAIGAFVIFGLLVFLIIHQSHKPAANNTAAGTETITKDPTSGQDVRTIKGENQNIGGDPNAPIYLGVDTFITKGLTTNQLNNMEAAFENYSVQNKLGIKQVSINTATVTTGEIDAPDGSKTYTFDFDVVFDSKTTRHAQLQYSGLSTVELFLYTNKGGSRIYDSGIISYTPPPASSGDNSQNIDTGD